MKIYEIGTGYTPIPAQISAATEIVVEELTKSFVEMDVDVEVIDIATSSRTENDLPIVEVKIPSFFAKKDVSLGILHKLKRIVYSIALAEKLKKILKKSSEKVVLHFHNQYNLFFFLKLVSKKRRGNAIIAYTNHNGMWCLPWEEMKATLRKRYFQEIVAMRNAHIVFVLNNKTKENVKEHLGLSEKCLMQIVNGVNTDIYCPLDKEARVRIKEKYNLVDKKIILQVGSIYENKGQERTLKMLASLLKQDKNLVFAYAGGIVSQKYFEQIGAMSRSLGLEDQVVYLGAVSPGKEMNEVYNIADTTIFLSKYEGFPLVCIESLSAGVPVILCSDSLLDLGDGCIMCTPEKVADIINGVFQDDNLRNKARNNAVNNYSWLKVTGDYAKTFKKFES